MDDEDGTGSTAPVPPGARDPRTMSAAAFHLVRWLCPEARAALAARPRFYSMPWLRLVTGDETVDPDDLPP